MNRAFSSVSPVARALLVFVLALLAGDPSFAATEDGGSGVVGVDRAFSLPLGRPEISVQGNLYSGDITPDDSRYFRLIPSVAIGLGGGFEASLALPIDGRTDALRDSAASFDRRLDLRDGAPTLKARWSGNALGPRFRIGVMGFADVSLGSGDRPGAASDSDERFDPGLVGLLSTDFGWHDVPFRLHANAGYWWSRDDGTIRFRRHPGALQIPGFDASRNDVAFGGIALEAGLRGAALFGELITEQLVDGEDFLSGGEQYWRLNAGARFMLARSIAMTAALSFDLSSDDSATDFDPGSVYADTELKLGFDFGRVFAQERYEDARRSRERARVDTAAAAASAAPPAVSAGAGAVDQRLEMMEDRIRDLEIRLRIEEIDNRLRRIEERGGLRAPAPDSGAVGLRGVLEGVRSARTAGAEASGVGEAGSRAEQAAGPAEDDESRAEGATSRVDATGWEGATGREDAASRVDATGREVATEVPKSAPAPRTAEAALREPRSDPARPAPREGRARSGEPAREPRVAADVRDDDRTAEVAAAAAGGYVLGRVTERPASGEARRPIADSEMSAAADTIAAGESLESARPEELAPPATRDSNAIAAGVPDAGEASPAQAIADAYLPIVGERRDLEIRFDPAAPGSILQDSVYIAVLDGVAAELAAAPESRIVVLAHAGGATPEDALWASDSAAALVRHYLILAGANEEQVQALGMGASEASPADTASTSRIEIARSR